MKYAGALLTMLLSTSAMAQPWSPSTGNSVNPVPGAVWQYLGPTLGGDWSTGPGSVGPATSVVNEIAVWNDTFGSHLRNGGAITHSGTMDLTATASAAAAVRGLFGAHPQNLYSFTDSTTPGMSGPNSIGTAGHEFDVTVPGGYTISGGFHAPLISDIQFTGNATFAAGGVVESFFGSWSTAGASATCGGAVSPGTAACKVYGGTMGGGLNAGATGFQAVLGAEFDSFMASGSSANAHLGILISPLGSLTRGTVYDAGIMFGDLVGGFGFLYGIDFGSTFTGAQAVATTGTLIGADNTYTVANLIDFHSVSCTGTAFQMATGLSAFNCLGNLLVQTVAANPALVVKTTGAADAVISIVDGNTGQQDLINFVEGASTTKWTIGKGSDQSWLSKDVVNNDNFMSVTTAGLLTLGETASGVGNQLTLSRAGAAKLTNLPTAGTIAASVCMAADGSLIKKTTTGACL